MKSPFNKKGEEQDVNDEEVVKNEKMQSEQVEQKQNGNGKKKVEDAPKSPNADDMKGTVADPVAFSNPAYDASKDASEVEGGKKTEGVHEFKMGHHYKKGDQVTWNGGQFTAAIDMDADTVPNPWIAN